MSTKAKQDGDPATIETDGDSPEMWSSQQQQSQQQPQHQQEDGDDGCSGGGGGRDSSSPSTKPEEGTISASSTESNPLDSVD